MYKSYIVWLPGPFSYIGCNLLLRRVWIHPWSRDQRWTVDPRPPSACSGHRAVTVSRTIGASNPSSDSWSCPLKKSCPRDISEMERKMMESILVSKWYELEIMIYIHFFVVRTRKKRICKFNIEITLKIVFFVFSSSLYGFFSLQGKTAGTKILPNLFIQGVGNQTHQCWCCQLTGCSDFSIVTHVCHSLKRMETQIDLIWFLDFVVFRVFQKKNVGLCF